MDVIPDHCIPTFVRDEVKKVAPLPPMDDSHSSKVDAVGEQLGLKRKPPKNGRSR